MFKLQKGDKIGIVSPSCGLENKSLNNALNYFANKGFIPVLGKHVNSQYRYMAGTDEERASDIMSFFADKSIKAIFCTRGGAGSIRLLSYLDYDIIKQNPKPIFGFSDSTALQNGIYSKTKNISYTGLLLTYDFSDTNLNSLQNEGIDHIFSGRHFTINSGITVNSGLCKGTIIGGNFYALMSLCGTPYFPNLKNKILLLEDVGIKSYQLDLMLCQLSMQKDFSEVRGIIFGQYENIRIVDECDGSVDDNIEYFSQTINIPVIKNFTYGHTPARYILPIGKQVTLDTEHCIIHC